MDKNVIVPAWDNEWNKAFAVCFVGRHFTTGEYLFSHEPDKCRTYLNEILYQTWSPDFKHRASRVTKPEFILDKDNTLLFMHVSRSYKFKNEEIKENLKTLNSLEEKYGIEKTTIVPVKEKTKGFLFVGDKAWQSNLWKLTVYSYLIKRVIVKSMSLSENELQSVMEQYKEQFLSKVKALKREDILLCDTRKFNGLVNRWYSVHEKSGFYSIAKMQDHPMRKFILEN